MIFTNYDEELQKEYKYDAVLTVREAMDYLRIGRTNLYKLIKNGELEYYRVGVSYRLPKDSLDKYIENNRTKKHKKYFS